MAARVGVETDAGFMAVRAENNLRMFPGKLAGFEFRYDLGGTFAEVVATGTAGNFELRLVSKGNGDITLWNNNGTKQLALFREAGTLIVNYPDFIASLTGTPVQLKASGADTNIDLQLTPQGTGNIRFGSFTVNADAPVTGYVTIKDAAGNARKLAVIA
jgi:hypothetical protein